ncbi:MAG TPA: IS66 family insertion sequence element accessory protein TnpB [Gemmataceae bacterium]|jgi:transposase|nr:IS66 family insertion sequence element accessory protein TnpB [Gemmataceae bacterium]
MLSFPPAVRIWLALAPADLRKGFDALAELVRQHLRDDPLSGHVFVFRNRRSDRIKLLYWDTDGYVIVYKRLEAGVFRFPAAEGQAGVTLRAAELAMLLDGVDWQSAKRSKRYHRPATATGGAGCAG